jgi:hypothetical protein
MNIEVHATVTRFLGIINDYDEVAFLLLWDMFAIDLFYLSYFWKAFNT